MSRTIKFRVRNKEKNYWVHGPHENPHLDGVNLFGECILLGGFMNVPLQELNECVALQYTGLEDKNGREIFEGDIVKFDYFGFDGNEIDKNGVGAIEYDPTGLFLIVDKREDLMLAFYETTHFEEPCIEVVGNIFDNPELLN